MAAVSAAAATRVVARVALRRRRSARGSASLAIDELVSPLRYDVVIRAGLFDEIASSPDPDASEFLDQASRSPYGTWFRHVAAARFRPDLLDDEGQLSIAFANRVRGAIRLWRSFRATGFDLRYPITVRRPTAEATTPTGVTVARKLHLADGCHRLALLRHAGVRGLTPDYYRVDPRPVRALPDNTAVLLPLINVTDEEYFHFVGAGYGVPSVSDRAALLDAVERQSPERLDEVRRIVAGHRPE